MTVYSTTLRDWSRGIKGVEKISSTDAEMQKFKQEYQDYYIVACVRNPFSRLVSAFFWASKMLKGCPDFSMLPYFVKKYRINERDSFNSRIYQVKDRVNFMQFIKYIKDLGPENVNEHFRMQTANKVWKSGVIKQIIYMENLQEDLSKIAKAHNFPWNVSNIRCLNAQQGLTKKKISNLSKRSLTYLENYYCDKNGKFRSPSYEWFYDEKALKEVVSLYREDFEILGYCTENPSFGFKNPG